MVLNRTFGCVRLVWNKTLVERTHRWQSAGKRTKYRETDAALTGWKRTNDLGFLSEVASVPLQQTLRHQHSAFSNFFAGRARHPRLKSRLGRQSAHYTRAAFRMRAGQLFLAKIATPLTFVWSWPEIDIASLQPTTVVVAREPDGRWYVTFSLEIRDPDPLPDTGRTVGLDLGVTHLVTTSDGAHIPNPRHLKRKARNLARYQRRMARCQRGSNNMAKAKARVARAHRKVRDARRDFLNRTTTNIMRNHDLIAIEDLAVKHMVRNRRLSGAIADCGWGEFRTMLEYKAGRFGRVLVVIDRWYPSSKSCSNCGHRLRTLDMSTRNWTCPNCRTRHDRDVNAAKNILAAGLAVTGGMAAGDACGAGVRHSESVRMRPAVKQEARTVRCALVGTRLPARRTPGWEQVKECE